MVGKRLCLSLHECQMFQVMCFFPGMNLVQLFKFLTSRPSSGVPSALHFISWRYTHRLLILWTFAVVNSFLGLLEFFIYGQSIGQQEIDPHMVFIVGHPRSGTTHLHNILTLDPKFGFIDHLQAFYPNCCFVMKGWLSWFLQLFMSDTRPMDQVPLHLRFPAEDESAINILSGGMSPYGVFSIAPRWRTYLRYLTLSDCTLEELECWKYQFMRFLKKCTYACGGKPLVLKSPPHSARIPILMELFPQAKFVLIERNPEHVLASFQYLVQDCYTYSFIADTNKVELTEYMFHHYKIVEESLQQAKTRIPADRLCSVSFEDLEKDPHGVLARVYDTFDWDGVDHVQDLLKTYLEKIGPYQVRNERLSEPLRKRLQDIISGCSRVPQESP